MIRVLLVLLAAGCGASHDPEPQPEPAPPAEPVEPAPSEPIPTEPHPSSERPCGSRGMAPCADTEYCDFADGTNCGAADEGGVCRGRPQMCTRELNPVCGCDGRTYPTRCVAASQGMDTATMGACPGSPPP